MTDLSIGDISWTVMWAGDKLQLVEYHLKSIRRHKGIKFAYWVWKNPSTWGKVSTKHGDFNWFYPLNPLYREKVPLSSGRPYSASKLGAISEELAYRRNLIKEKEFDYDGTQEELETQIKILTRRQKTLRNQKSNKKIKS